MEKQFDLEKTLKDIDIYAETQYSHLPIPNQSKVFYRINEWSGWRFYLKAIRHRDWKSLWQHIKSKITL
jgi:hypothetical protein